MIKIVNTDLLIELENQRIDFIAKKALEKARRLEKWIGEKYRDELSYAVSDYFDDKDRIVFLVTIFNYYSDKKNEYELDRVSDSTIIDRLFYIKFELENTGFIHYDENEIIGIKEEEELDSVIQTIQTEIDVLKTGQKIIYDDIMNDLKIARNLIYEGKSNLRSILIGKSTEWGISETLKLTIGPILKELFV